MLTQFRRVESLYRRVSKLARFEEVWDSTLKQLEQEWQKIRRQWIGGQAFAVWVQDIPELGPCPREVPDGPWLHALQQHLRFVLEALLAQEHDHRIKIQQMRHKIDVSDGHSKETFAQVRGPGLPPFRVVVTDLDEEAIPVLESLERIRLYVDHAARFVQQEPLFVDNQPVHLLAQDDHSLLVMPLPGTQVILPHDTCQVHQKVHHCSEHEVSQLLTDYWAQFWQRDQHTHDPSEIPSCDEDPTFQLLCRVLPRLDWTSWTNPHTLDNWTSALKHIKADSASGVDAISFRELRALPTPLLQQLVDLVNSWGQFPQWMMLSRTVLQAGDSRPITIMSSIYRAVYRQQIALELARRQGLARQGITLDLRKCFNLIDRRKLYLLFDHLGFPRELLDKWFRSLSKLTRYWDLRGYCSEQVPSSTGCPEGDGWSVIAMVAISWAWVAAIHSLGTDMDSSAYADNWPWWGATTCHNDTLRITNDVCAFLGLEVDWSKTWIWSSDGAFLPELQQLVVDHGGVSHVTVKRNAVDLGCPVTYTSNASARLVEGRFSQAKRRLHRVRQHKWAHEVKLHMIRASVYPSAFYGSELLLVPTMQLDSLRTQLAYAILGSACQTVSAALLVHVLPKVLDPVVHTIVQALRQAKQWLFNATAEDRATFLAILAAPSRNSHVQGPASALREYCLRVGLSVDKQGNILGAEGDGLHLLTSPWDDLQQAVQLEWQKQLLPTQTTRKHIARQLPVDRNGTIQVLRRFPGHQRVVLLREIAGGFQTQVQQSRWDDVSDQRQLCHAAPDTRQHRVLECSAFESLRLEHAETLTKVREHRPFLCHLPAMREDTSAFFARLLRAQFPEPDLAPVVFQRLQSLGPTPAFYTDGSCNFPQFPTVRFASYAVIADLAVSDEQRKQEALTFKQTGHMPQMLVPVAVARLAGRQCIQRAELSAILWVLSRFAHATVYTDSQFSSDWVRDVSDDGGSANVPLHSDFDLLQQLQRCLTQGHTVRKIKAHRECADISDLLECYHALGNRAADTAAGEANRTLFPEIAAQLTDQATSFVQELDFYEDFYKFLWRQSQLRHKLATEEAGTSEPDVNTLKLVERFKTWTAAGQWRFPAAITEEWLPHSDVGISWAEIAVALAMVHGQWLPVIRTREDGHPYLSQPCTDQEAQLLATCLPEQAQSAAQIYTHFVSLVPEAVTPTLERKKVRTLQMYGASFRLSGLSLRPSFSSQADVIDIMQQFVPGRCSTLPGLPTLQWDGDFECWPEDAGVFGTSMAERKAAVIRAQQQVYRRRRDISRYLQFSASPRSTTTKREAGAAPSDLCGEPGVAGHVQVEPLRNTSRACVRRPEFGPERGIRGFQAGRRQSRIDRDALKELSFSTTLREALTASIRRLMRERKLSQLQDRALARAQAQILKFHLTPDEMSTAGLDVLTGVPE
eukprot:Skav228165  [mRNA]  locus=scaffold439:319957:327714:+ [translate_table: standard]